MNEHYKKLRVLLAILGETTGDNQIDLIIKDAMQRNGTPVSNSKLQGWRVSKGHKNYRAMTEDELLRVMSALVDYLNNLSKLAAYLEKEDNPGN